jgi:SAM-dependent methyltransferase
LTGRSDYFEANRIQWDDRAAIHLESSFYDVEGWLRSKPGPRAHERAALGHVEDLTLVHLQCHFGLDTLAFARAGAVVTGLDFSPTAVAAACELAERADLAERARFVCANVEEAPEALGHDTFDIVYVSLGALCWLPSVNRWADAVTALLGDGGRLYVHDGHPLSWALADEDLTLTYTYFEEEQPFVVDDTETYTDQQRPLAHARNYQWNHSLGEIVTALVSRGLRVTELTEHDWTVWPRWPWLVQVGSGHDTRWAFPEGGLRLPLSFTLLAERPRAATPSDREVVPPRHDARSSPPPPP